jgi:streptomycin 6-kinase
MMLELPPEFTQTIQNTFEEDGKRWLESLPALLAEASRRWDLMDIQPVLNLSYNFVSFALSGANDSERNRSAISPIHPSTTDFDTVRAASTSVRDGKLNPPLRAEVVLKLGVPNRELTSEIAALRLYNGRGACRLLDADAEKGMLLLERLQPGHMLAMLEDDVRATEIAADVMKNLWTCSSDFAKHPVRVSRFGTTAPAPASGGGEVVTTDFIYLKDWFEGFKRLRKRFNGETGPLPKHLVETAESLSTDLLAENKNETLLHGDFHHFNVLESARGWLAIDPKGVIGPRGYEVGPFLINPNDRFLNGCNPKVQTEKRIAILSEILDMERERIRAWSICHAVLSAWWSIEDNDPGWGEYSLRCAEIFMQIKT